MKRYAFPLARVLRVRQAEEDRAAAALAAARHAADAADTRLEARRASYREALGGGPGPAGAPPGRAGVAAEEFLAWRERAELAGAAVVAAAADRAEARAEAERRRAEWAMAAIRVGTLEHLDERLRSSHKVTVRRAEVTAVDDVVNRRRS